MSNKSIIISISAVLLLTALCIIGINFYLYIVPDEPGSSFPSAMGDFQYTGEFRIDPKATLIDLQNGKTDIFSPVLATPEVYTPLANGDSFLWDFSDHRKVAAVLWQQVWGDSMNDWNIFSMYFLADCQDPLNGFSIGDFEYFKPIKTQQGNGYADREILLSPLYGDASWGSSTSYPRPLFGWKEIKFTDIKITPDDALRIAEENGGREARLAVKNECNIFLVYSPNYHSNGWHLAITHNNELPHIFEINIDPYTGKFKVIEPSK